jgi:YebC/PmpR family DNA-binding regulatory protein
MACYKFQRSGELVTYYWYGPVPDNPSGSVRDPAGDILGDRITRFEPKVSPMSGHSKWSTIKRQKGATDAKRGQLFTKLAREITVAARSGLPDPESNGRLRLAVQRARAENMPRDNIERAIERASASGAGDNFEEVTYEAFLPGGIALMVQSQTDNRNRTVSEVRAVITRGGGNVGADGSVAWMFDNVGQIVVKQGEMSEDDLAMLAIDAGATEFEPDGETTVVFTEPSDLHKVQETLTRAGLEIDSADLVMKAKDLIAVEPDQAVKVIRVIEKLEDLDDVQNVYTNLEVTDEVFAQVSA